MTTNLELQIKMWHENKFGPDEKERVPATYRKLLEEVGELGETLFGGTAAEIRVEAGDVGIVLLSLLRLATGEESLQMAMAGAHYMELDHVGDPTYTPEGRALDRPQMELIAARVSAINACFY